MNALFYQLRGIKDWPLATATVTSTKVVGTGRRSGRTMNVCFDYVAGSSSEDGKFFVDDNSSIYGLEPGDTFSIQFNPSNPASYYCAEAKSLSQTIRNAIVAVGVTFAIVVFLIEFFGNTKR